MGFPNNKLTGFLTPRQAFYDSQPQG